MIEFGMMEYMTVLGMNMVLLFLDSRYSRRRTVLAVYSTMFAAMIAVAVVYRTAGLKATLWLPCSPMCHHCCSFWYSAASGDGG